MQMRFVVLAALALLPVLGTQRRASRRISRIVSGGRGLAS